MSVVDSLRDVGYVFGRAQSKFWGSPIRIFFQLFGALMFLVLFTQLFSKLSDLPGFPTAGYLEIAVGGILFLNTLNSTMQSANAIVDELNTGYLANILVTPVKRSAILLGRVLSDGVRYACQTSIVLGIAFLMGATFATGVPGVLVIYLIVVGFGVAWSGLTMTVGLATKSNETVSVVGTLLTFPLMFTSTALLPVSFLPRWMQTVTQYNPISYMSDAARSLMVSGFDGTVLLQAFAVIGLILVLTWSSTLWLFRSVVR